MFRNERVERPPEYNFTSEDIGYTETALNSWSYRHRRAVAMASLATLSFGTFGGGYVGYKKGEAYARSEAHGHVEAAAILRDCIDDLSSYTKNGEAIVRFASLSETTQEKCGVIGLSDSTSEAPDQFYSWNSSNFEANNPRFDAEITFDVAGMQYDAGVHDQKSKEGDKLEKTVGAALGTLLGFTFSMIGITIALAPKAFLNKVKKLGRA